MEPATAKQKAILEAESDEEQLALEKMSTAHDGSADGPHPESQTQQAPDVSSDRVPATDAEPEGSLDRVKTAPLNIQDIENLEDDAKGG
jgi:hypothetical protein